MNFIDQCNNNPRGGGHCDHSKVIQRQDGSTAFVQICCWCGRGNTVEVKMPEHGRHAPDAKYPFGRLAGS